MNNQRGQFSVSYYAYTTLLTGRGRSVLRV